MQCDLLAVLFVIGEKLWRICLLEGAPRPLRLALVVRWPGLLGGPPQMYNTDDRYCYRREAQETSY